MSGQSCGCFDKGVHGGASRTSFEDAMTLKRDRDGASEKASATSRPRTFPPPFTAAAPFISDRNSSARPPICTREMSCAGTPRESRAPCDARKSRTGDRDAGADPSWECR